MRIPTLLEKISALATLPESRTAIDVDLMLDYTRVLYADLLEWRARMVAHPTESAAPVFEAQAHSEPKAFYQEAASDKHSAAVVEIDSEPFLELKQSQQIDWLKAGQLTQKSDRDIRNLIGINDKYQILSELFGNDKGSYEEALDFINKSEAEADALNWLREQLWITEERSDAAQNFYEIVSRHFGH
ncbi:MAG: hypothetical protein JST06_10615 [Bacteroidetes bacterium]|nr:hypothetical protein [Bacteroidota bacterium]MBS1629793.1 hypothetical protein [Bacteroidota bacterium]